MNSLISLIKWIVEKVIGLFGIIFVLALIVGFISLIVAFPMFFIGLLLFLILIK